jgi:hypothetical protein
VTAFNIISYRQKRAGVLPQLRQKQFCFVPIILFWKFTTEKPHSGNNSRSLSPTIGKSPKLIRENKYNIRREIAPARLTGEDRDVRHIDCVSRLLYANKI